MTQTTTTSPAAEFAALVEDGGWTVEFSKYAGGDVVVTVERTFEANDLDAYVDSETRAGEILRLAPMTYPGTIWGTDGASVGGHAGLTGGYFRLSKSGVGTRFAKAAAKATGVEIATRP